MPDRSSPSHLPDPEARELILECFAHAALLVLPVAHVVRAFLFIYMTEERSGSEVIREAWRSLRKLEAEGVIRRVARLADQVACEDLGLCPFVEKVALGGGLRSVWADVELVISLEDVRRELGEAGAPPATAKRPADEKGDLQDAPSAGLSAAGEASTEASGAGPLVHAALVRGALGLPERSHSVMAEPDAECTACGDMFFSGEGHPDIALCRACWKADGARERLRRLLESARRITTAQQHPDVSRGALSPLNTLPPSGGCSAAAKEGLEPPPSATAKPGEGETGQRGHRTPGGTITSLKVLASRPSSAAAKRPYEKPRVRELPALPLPPPPVFPETPPLRSYYEPDEEYPGDEAEAPAKEPPVCAAEHRTARAACASGSSAVVSEPCPLPVLILLALLVLVSLRPYAAKCSTSPPDHGPGGFSRQEDTMQQHAARLIDRLKEELYPEDKWAMLAEVRNTVGIADVIRYADAIAIDYGSMGRLRIHGFEVKLTRKDWEREMDQPEKSGPLQACCDAFWLVVPEPRKKIILSTELELPSRWGLISVGTGGARIIEPALEREAEQPPPGFILSALRNALRAGQRAPDLAGVPIVRINRPRASSTHMTLVCGHAAPRPGGKVIPLAVPCYGCFEGRPIDHEYLEAALLDLGREDKDRLRELLNGRAPARTGDAA